jgi:Flp pilus assembly protein TadB
VTVWWAALAAALAAVLAIPPRARWPALAATPPTVHTDDAGWMHRWRWLWALLAGIAAATFVSGTPGVPVGAAAGVATWVWIGRSEPTPARRRRQAGARDLPALVHLLATALESGCGVGPGVQLVCDALPGPASRLLGNVPARLALGVPPEAAWQPVLEDPQLAPLGRAMVRAHRSGSSVTHEVARLADELDRRTQTSVEERARAVGVKAAVPLGVCLLPSFLLIGVVPLVVGLLRSLSL